MSSYALTYVALAFRARSADHPSLLSLAFARARATGGYRGRSNGPPKPHAATYAHAAGWRLWVGTESLNDMIYNYRTLHNTNYINSYTNLYNDTFNLIHTEYICISHRDVGRLRLEAETGSNEAEAAAANTGAPFRLHHARRITRGSGTSGVQPNHVFRFQGLAFPQGCPRNEIHMSVCVYIYIYIYTYICMLHVMYVTI